jgi:hypothetical protein
MASAAQASGYANLPRDVLNIVFSHLEIPDLARVESVCKNWKANTEQSWEAHFSRDWPNKPKDNPLYSAKLCYQIEINREKMIASIDNSAGKNIESGIPRRNRDSFHFTKALIFGCLGLTGGIIITAVVSSLHNPSE